MVGMLAEAVIDIAAGSLGGAAGIFIGQPFDVVKTRAHLSACGSSNLTLLRTVLAKEGKLALWRGMTPPLLGTGLYQGCCFMSYNVGTHLMNSVAPEASETTKVVGAGTFAGVVCTLVNTPVDALKIALQKQTGEMGAGGLRQVMKTWKPFHGWWSCVARDVPSTPVYFYAFESAKNDFGFSTFNAGGIAGTVSWAMCSPFDLIKTRHQSTPGATFFSATKDIYATNGWRGFTKGAVPLILRAYPSTGATFVAYHWWLSVINGEE